MTNPHCLYVAAAAGLWTDAGTPPSPHPYLKIGKAQCLGRRIHTLNNGITWGQHESLSLALRRDRVVIAATGNEFPLAQAKTLEGEVRAFLRSQFDIAIDLVALREAILKEVAERGLQPIPNLSWTNGLTEIVAVDLSKLAGCERQAPVHGWTDPACGELLAAAFSALRSRSIFEAASACISLATACRYAKGDAWDQQAACARFHAGRARSAA